MSFNLPVVYSSKFSIYHSISIYQQWDLNLPQDFNLFATDLDLPHNFNLPTLRFGFTTWFQFTCNWFGFTMSWFQFTTSSEISIYYEVKFQFTAISEISIYRSSEFQFTASMRFQFTTSEISVCHEVNFRFIDLLIWIYCMISIYQHRGFNLPSSKLQFTKQWDFNLPLRFQSKWNLTLGKLKIFSR